MASKKQRQRRGKRPQARHERRVTQHSGGGDWDCVKVPAGLSTFKPKVGDDKTVYHIDVIPYIVGDRNKNADTGDEYFELSYPVYNGLGIHEKRYVAIGEMLSINDPVAEHFATLRKAGAEWDDMKMFKPTWRQIMLIFVHEEASKGLQFFEAAYGTFGELLDEEIQSDESDHVENFDDPDAGSTLEVRFKAKNIGQPHPWIKVSKINFVERPDGFTANGNEKLAAEIMEKASAICLDACLKMADYATLKSALDGQPTTSQDGNDDNDAEDAEDTEDTPEKKEPTGRKKRVAPPEKKKPVEEVEEEDDADEEWDDDASDEGDETVYEDVINDLAYAKGDEVESKEYGTCSVLKVTENGTLTLIDEDDEVHFDVPAESLAGAEVEESVKKAKAPKTTKKTAAAAGAAARERKAAKTETTKKKDDAEEDWDEDWDD